MNMQMQWGCHDGSVWPHNGEICNSLQSEQLLLWDKNRFEFCCHALGAFSIMLCVFNLLWSYCVACVPLIDTVREAVFSVPHGGSEISSVHVSFISTIVLLISDLLGVRMFKRTVSYSSCFCKRVSYSDSLISYSQEMLLKYL